MQHQILGGKSWQSDDFSVGDGNVSPPSLAHKIEASTAIPSFAEFVGPMLRNAGVFTACHDTKPVHDIWMPIQPPEAAPILDWVRRELLTFGYLVELGFTNFSFTKYVDEDLARIHKAFRSLLDGHAYLTLVDAKPAVAIFNGVQRTLLAAAPRNIDALGGDPVDSLHDFLRGAALIKKPHSQEEIYALLHWADEVFVSRAIEAFTVTPSVSGKTPWPSNAERESIEIVSVVLGRRAVTWATDQAVFESQCKISKRAPGLRLRRVSARRAKQEAKTDNRTRRLSGRAVV